MKEERNEWPFNRYLDHWVEITVVGSVRAAGKLKEINYKHGYLVISPFVGTHTLSDNVVKYQWEKLEELIFYQANSIVIRPTTKSCLDETIREMQREYRIRRRNRETELKKEFTKEA